MSHDIKLRKNSKKNILCVVLAGCILTSCAQPIYSENPNSQTTKLVSDTVVKPINSHFAQQSSTERVLRVIAGTIGTISALVFLFLALCWIIFIYRLAKNSQNPDESHKINLDSLFTSDFKVLHKQKKHEWSGTGNKLGNGQKTSTNQNETTFLKERKDLEKARIENDKKKTKKLEEEKIKEKEKKEQESIKREQLEHEKKAKQKNSSLKKLRTHDK